MKNKALTLLFTAATLAASAQLTSSPYSRFGYGILGDNATSAQTQMGGVGYAMHSGRQINAMNPASYAATDSLTFLFDMGLDLTNVWRGENGSNEHSIGGGLDYITMQFPLCRFMGMSLGLVPWSSVGYAFGSKIENGSSTHEGTGGLNNFYLGVAGRIPGGVSVGMNVSYFFGTIYNDVYALINTSSTSLFEQVVQVRDYNLEFGAQYELRLNADHSLTAGLTYTPGKSFLGHTWIQKYAVGTDAAPDTIGYSTLKDCMSRPEKWGAGLSYAIRNKLTAEVDFTWQPWSKARITSYEDFTATRFADRWKIAAGASFTPNQRGGYLQRMSYRLGAHFTRDYMMVGDNHVKEFGVSCGFGLPAPGQKTVINLGLEYLHRRASPETLLSENYFNIRLGINFNQLWFMQSKLR